jgi:hypothetical protein
MAREELSWQNIDADDSPAAVKKSFDAWRALHPQRNTPRCWYRIGHSRQQCRRLVVLFRMIGER